MITNATIARLKEALTRMDAPLFKGELNLTLVGIRSADTDANTFNDLLCVLYEKDGKLTLQTFPVSTDPGIYYREHPINVDGTAILKPGHYPGCWLLGVHRGQYKALVQRGPMTVYRDRNKDGKLDMKNEATGYFGINLHHASFNGVSHSVDRWSAGCQVLANIDDFNALMTLVKQAAEKYGPHFSYTLMDEADLCATTKDKDSQNSSVA